MLVVDQPSKEPHLDGMDTDNELFVVIHNDEPATAAFDRIDNAYLAIEIDVAPARQAVAAPRQHEAPSPRDSDAPTSRCSVVFAPGNRVGKYILGDKLGQGTFGVVHLAHDVELDRDVALKLLNPSHNDNDDVLHRFLQEGRAAARIPHPGIVTVHDCGRAIVDGAEIAYIAMERLEGESLGSRLKRCGRMAPETAAEICRQVASALAAAHTAGVLHRDLKPENIFIVPDPAVPVGERVKVLDFGLAKLANFATTGINAVFGTPRYMSPEQCRSSARIDERTDIYALGCILFELVTGRTPFEGELYRILEKHLTTAPPRARTLAPEVPVMLDALINRMLAKDAIARPASMAEVESALRSAGAITPGAADTIVPGSLQSVRLPAELDARPTVDHLDDAETRAHEKIDLATPSEPVIALRAPATTTTPTPTHVVIRPLQRRRSLGPLVAIAITVAIGVAITLLATAWRSESPPTPAATQPAGVPSGG